MDQSISRRDLFRRGRDIGGLTAFASVLPMSADAAPAAPSGAVADDGVYRRIGVRPFINARGTYTVLSGSLMLPEVRAAMDLAARQYVHLDELTEAIGGRLAALTGAEWGLVTSGCAAALTHATAACVAGGNPDLHIRIPHLAGFPKDEVVIPTHSRNVYDAALRVVGVRVIEAATRAEFDAALGPRTAMIYVLAGPAADESALNLQAIAPLAAARGVPILVDAAAEILTIPNVHLARGATLVGYSGGKCLRGPQTAGLLLGRKDLVTAAWVHSAPHHGFARGHKVGKEEAIGMLAAVEQWVRRDHDGERARWTSWLEHIASRVDSVESIETEVVQPAGLSNRTPSLRIRWSTGRIGLTGDAVARTLFSTEPRISLFPLWSNPEQRSGVSITPYMLVPGDERVIADRLAAVLAAAPRPEAAAAPAAPVADLTGTWRVEIAYAASRSTHTLHLRQRGGEVDGTHQGEFVSRGLTGEIAGREVTLRSHYGEEHGDALSFRFTGTVDGDTMTGTLDMGEYLHAAWRATRG
jgi:L-seryl-tRNA(Ser) seleniumtransferase